MFVSKVLGRHIPVKPSVMQQTYTSLAEQIPEDLPGPVMVFGMAETAVGLGAGVHRATQAVREDTFYLISSRHDLGTPIFARFEEEHSHASAHLIHLPTDPQVQSMLKAARSIVLVDDEASTGKTFINLLAALETAGLSNLEKVVTVTLTDWSDNAVQKAIGPKASSISLLAGSYAFSDNPDAPLPVMPDVSTTSAGSWPINPENDWGRLGVTAHDDTLQLKNMPEPGEKVLIVGTNEFVWRPFLLAERLEKSGVDVYFSSTTRSPIALGHEIKHVLAFGDNYGLGIPNFLYNVGPGQFDRVIVCTETDPAAVDAKLLNALNAEVVSDV
ncbi:MAG: phosphoribosyltransferase [Pseudomonadales bacterium]|nr:phosphoribosyltransferase [Pseudomonadales bacterium]